MMAGQDISVGNLYGSTLVGLVVAIGMFVITEYYTSKKYWPVKSIAKASETGHGTNIIRGLGLGMQSTAFPVLLIAFGTIISFCLAGIYGVALAVIAMLSLSGIVVGVDAYRPNYRQRRRNCRNGRNARRCQKNYRCIRCSWKHNKSSYKRLCYCFCGAGGVGFVRCLCQKKLPI